MSLGLIGTKVGMTRVFEGKVAIPVTVVDIKGNVVVQVKNRETDGYEAVQVGFGFKRNRAGKPRAGATTKPMEGHFEKAGTESRRHLREFRVEAGELTPGTELDPTAMFAKDGYVDVVGTTKGKGFQGVVKRHGFAGSMMTHGSMMHRRPGAIGCRSTPGLVWKNQKMPGHDGVRRRTTQNLQIVQVRAEDGVLLIRGNLPGSNGSTVIIRPALKKPAKA